MGGTRELTKLCACTYNYVTMNPTITYSYIAPTKINLKNMFTKDIILASTDGHRLPEVRNSLSTVCASPILVIRHIFNYHIQNEGKTFKY